MLSKARGSQKDKKRVGVQIAYRTWVQTNLQTDNLLSLMPKWEDQSILENCIGGI